ncbi:TsaD/Kae1/Qri7 protein [Bacteroides pyogenes JCM 10003]|nr:TsaD/Kae1/Qri7 protein [Bacteroides pyogenes JCM 10003]
MNYAEICIIKRDGKREDFSISKIKNAISKAFNATGIQDEQQLIADITMNVISQFSTPTITVEEIQDLVEKELMKVRPEVAKKYIIYREWRNTERDKKTQMKHVMDGIVAIDKNDVNLSNANMSSHTPAGQMMTFASEVTKDYTYKYLLPKRFAEAHQLGDIHIHDLDYYPRRRLPAFNTIWTISSNGDSAPRTEASVRRRVFRVTPRWLLSSSRPTRTNSTADKPFPLSISSWRRE